MSTQAYVNSFEAVRDFRAALVVFLHEAREAIASHDLEVRRTLEWILDVEPQRWHQQARACADCLLDLHSDIGRRALPGFLQGLVGAVSRSVGVVADLDQLATACSGPAVRWIDARPIWRYRNAPNPA